MFKLIILQNSTQYAYMYLSTTRYNVMADPCHSCFSNNEICTNHCWDYDHEELFLIFIIEHIMNSYCSATTMDYSFFFHFKNQSADEFPI